jgi:hypothetical protein
MRMKAWRSTEGEECHSLLEGFRSSSTTIPERATITTNHYRFRICIHETAPQRCRGLSVGSATGECNAKSGDAISNHRDPSQAEKLGERLVFRLETGTNAIMSRTECEKSIHAKRQRYITLLA